MGIWINAELGLTVELGHLARSNLKELLQSFEMIMNIAMFFSLLRCETLIKK